MLFEIFDQLHDNHIKVKELCYIIIQYTASDFRKSNIIETVENRNLNFYKRVFSEIDCINEWWWISERWILSEAFIREFKDKVCWQAISCCQKLSEEFIREFEDCVDWKIISARKELSEPFIRKFKDYVNWSAISECQNLSEPFIREFKDYVVWSGLKNNEQLSDELKEKCKQLFNRKK